MEIIRKLDNLNASQKNCVVGLGNFDGIHLGHQEIVKNIVNVSRETFLRPAILTFDPHPVNILKPEKRHTTIYSLEEKLNLFEEMGIEIVFLLKFNKELLKISPEDFINKILVKKLKVNRVITGYNFNFGFKRKGNTFLLNKFASEHLYAYSSINQIKFKNFKVSTSEIKKLMSAGAISTANKILGRKYHIAGIVIEGKKLARKMGVPTANIALDIQKALPAFGVYLVKSQINEKRVYGIANLGLKPTFDELKPSLEVHFFDFNGDLYGQSLKVEFLLFVRPERRFENIEQLKSQIKLDVKLAKYAAKNLNYHFLDAQ